MVSCGIIFPSLLYNQLKLIQLIGPDERNNSEDHGNNCGNDHCGYEIFHRNNFHDCCFLFINRYKENGFI